MKVQTFGELLYEQRNMLKRAYELADNPVEKQCFEYALDSLDYIMRFYSGEYVLPSDFSIPADTEWARTHEYLWGSFLNLEKAMRLLNGKTLEESEPGVKKELEKLRAENKKLQDELQRLKYRKEKVAEIKKSIGSETVATKKKWSFKPFNKKV